MKEIENRMSNVSLYQSSGRAFVLEGLSSHASQRATARGQVVGASMMGRAACGSAAPLVEVELLVLFLDVPTLVFGASPFGGNGSAGPLPGCANPGYGAASYGAAATPAFGGSANPGCGAASYGAAAAPGFGGSGSAGPFGGSVNSGFGASSYGAAVAPSLGAASTGFGAPPVFTGYATRSMAQMVNKSQQHHKTQGRRKN